MLLMTDFSTASKMLNLNNPKQGTQCGVNESPTTSVSKRRDIDKGWQKSVICYIRAKTKN